MYGKELEEIIQSLDNHSTIQLLEDGSVFAISPVLGA